MPRKFAHMICLYLITGLSGATADWSVCDVGEYAGLPWADTGARIPPGTGLDRKQRLNLAVRSINLRDDLSDAHYEGWSHEARSGFEQGKKMLPRVYFWDGVDRFEGPMRDIEVYWQRMDRFLSSVDLKYFAGICLAEENVHYAGRPAVLNEMYRRIKAGYDTDVFQWYDNTVPSADMQADGWVINPYYTGGQEFRHFLQRYVVTGKPVVLMPWACGTGVTEWSPRLKLILEDHLRGALDYNLPVAFYWVGVRGGTSFGLSDSEPMKSINDRIFQWIDHIEALDPGYAGTPAADTSAGRILELSPQSGAETDQYVYADAFEGSHFIEDAHIEGFKAIRWGPDRAVRVHGDAGNQATASLTYRFSGTMRFQAPHVSLVVSQLDPGGSVSLAVSRDETSWIIAESEPGPTPQTLTLDATGDDRFEDLSGFAVRIEITGPPSGIAAADNLRIECDMAGPVDRAAPLRGLPHRPDRLMYEDDFETMRYLHHATIANGDQIEWQRGRLGIRMRPGGTRAQIVWRVQSKKAVREVRVRLTGNANNGSLATNHFLEISPDGLQWFHEQNTIGLAVNKSGWTRDDLAIDASQDPQFQNIREFFVRLRMESGGYKEPHRYLSGKITRLQIEARAELSQPN